MSYPVIWTELDHERIEVVEVGPNFYWVKAKHPLMYGRARRFRLTKNGNYVSMYTAPYGTGKENSSAQRVCGGHKEGYIIKNFIPYIDKAVAA